MLSFRQLLIIALVIGVLWVLARLRRRLRAARQPQPTPAVTYGDTVRCPRCGVYVPRQPSATAPACSDSQCPVRVQ